MKYAGGMIDEPSAIEAEKQRQFKEYGLFMSGDNLNITNEGQEGESARFHDTQKKAADNRKAALMKTVEECKKNLSDGSATRQSTNPIIKELEKLISLIRNQLNFGEKPARQKLFSPEDKIVKDILTAQKEVDTKTPRKE